MIKIYKKVNKTANNPYGCLEITNINDIKNPFLLCISGFDNYNKAVFGLIREGAHAARVYTTQEVAAGFNIDTMPIDFIGYTYVDDKGQKNSHELAHCLLLPFIKLHGINYQAMVKQARKINLFTFDTGVERYIEAEKEMFADLIKEGFSEGEVGTILSQICLLALGTNIDLTNLYATNFMFVDLNDKDIENEELLDYKRVLLEKRSCSMYVPIGEKDSIFFPFLGAGNHSVKDYLEMQSPSKPAICSMTVFCLQNSLANCKTSALLSVDKDDVYAPLYTYAANLRSVHDTMCILDNEVKYDNAPKYTLNEVQLRMELDSICRMIQKQQLSIENKDKNSQDLATKVNNLISSIRKYSSETTYYQILTDSHMWFPTNDVLSKESDKEIREKYEGKQPIIKTTPKKTKKTETKKVENKKENKKKEVKKSTKKKETKKTPKNKKK